MLISMTQIEEDAFAVLGELLKDIAGHPQQPSVSSLIVEKATGLTSQRVFDAIHFLKGQGSIKVITSMMVGHEYAVHVLAQSRFNFQVIKKQGQPPFSGGLVN